VQKSVVSTRIMRKATGSDCSAVERNMQPWKTSPH
jgi:hypothetical protein